MVVWNNFFVACVSAAAALAGLIFVGVSISLSRILSFPHLPGRALGSLILLMAILIGSLLCLTPGQPAFLLGIEILAIGVTVWVVTFRLDTKTWRAAEPQLKKYYRQNFLFTQLAVLPYLLGGVMMLAQGFSHIYWLVPGIIFSFIKSLTDAWVLLVEIHR